MSDVFFISDTHFNHANIISYCNRPFKDVEEMNDVLVENWNNVVGENDIVYHLGDFGFMSGPSPQHDIFHISRQLNGKIHLVRGNHDTRKMLLVCNFERVLSSPFFFDDFAILTHKPSVEVDPEWVRFYGHVHDSEEYPAITPRTACLCVEKWNYSPVPYEFLKQKMKGARNV